MDEICKYEYFNYDNFNFHKRKKIIIRLIEMIHGA